MRNYTQIELAWLAGLLEGEGCFNIGSDKYPVGIALAMTDEDIVSTVAGWWNVSYNSPKTQKEHHKQSYRCAIRGKSAVDLMVILLPFMGERRSTQIQKAIDSYSPKGYNRKISIEDALVVRDRFRMGESAQSLGTEFGISKWTVYSINQGRVKLD